MPEPTEQERIIDIITTLQKRGVAPADARRLAGGITRDGELSEAIRSTAKRIGANPVDLATVVHYETGGKLDPNMMGGKGNNYMGLIQFGPEERKKYGITKDMGITAYMEKAGDFLIDRGFKPGMGILDLYSTVNAGAPGLHNRSDSLPGAKVRNTVATHVQKMQQQYRKPAEQLMSLSGEMILPSSTPGNVPPISSKEVAPELKFVNSSGTPAAAYAQASTSAGGLSATEQELKKNSTPGEWAEYQKTRDPTFQDVVAPNTGAAPAGATSPSPEATPAGNPMTEAMPLTPEGQAVQGAAPQQPLNSPPVDARMYSPMDSQGQRYAMMNKYGLPPPPPPPPMEGAARFGPMIKPLMFQQFAGGFGGMFKGFFGGFRG